MYGIRLEATILCLGSDTRIKIHIPRVTLLPSRMEEGVEEAIRSIEDRTAAVALEDPRGLPQYSDPVGMSNSKEEEQLPSYETHGEGTRLG